MATGVLNIGSGSVHVTPDPFHQALSVTGDLFRKQEPVGKGHNDCGAHTGPGVG
ncbi:hypothetical protein ACFY71_37230 [Streptomyces cinerochromogenes]|uniref:hypothetical protein n=1 Tax=Streptomyces cinerochromogenes TaxID=66422 RepID=UPI003684737C